MKKNNNIVLENNEYEIVKDYKEAMDIDALKELYTDYFEDYDYLLGDWAYGKLRLKGFCDKQNKKNNKINSYDGIEKYIKDYCAYECRYFILKKINNNLTK